MKVSREPAFAPVTITLETPEELAVFFEICSRNITVGCAVSQSNLLEDLVEDREVKTKVKNMLGRFWRELDQKVKCEDIRTVLGTMPVIERIR